MIVIMMKMMITIGKKERKERKNEREKERNEK